MKFIGISVNWSTSELLIHRRKTCRFESYYASNKFAGQAVLVLRRAHNPQTVWVQFPIPLLKKRTCSSDRLAAGNSLRIFKNVLNNSQVVGSNPTGSTKFCGSNSTTECLVANENVASSNLVFRFLMI